jgi:hypothetical protein
MTMKLRLSLLVALVAFLSAPVHAVETAPTPGYATPVAPPAIAVPLPPPAPGVPAATQNTVTTTGPVTSDTTISVGTLAGQVLTWIAAVFGVPIGGLLTAWLYRLSKLAGVQITDAMRARLQDIVVNGLNIGVRKAATDLRGRGQVDVKNEAVAHAVEYVQVHGADSLKALGIDPGSELAVEAIKARIETAITDVNAPTPKVLASSSAS